MIANKVRIWYFFYVLFASVSGTFSFIREGVVERSIIYSGVIVAIGSLVGVYIGTKIMEKIKLHSHRIALLCAYAFSIVVTSVSLAKKMGLLEY